MNLISSIVEIKGVGEKKANLYNRLGIYNVSDLLQYYPRKYLDYSNIAKISAIKPGNVTVQVEFTVVKTRYLRRGLNITEAIAKDETGSIRVIWFNQPYRATSIKINQQYFMSGNYELSHQKFSINNPSIELVSDFPINTARVLPKYRETKGLNSREIRKAVSQIIDFNRLITDELPDYIITEHNLLTRSDAIKKIHFPKNNDDLALATRRFGFQEVFELVLASELSKRELNLVKSIRIKFIENLAKDFVSKLPFTLTNDQKRAIWQIYLDVDKTRPMNRLVEGDVGSGKTVVATMAALMVIEEGYQVALMAPTELLAKQHAETIYNLLKPLNKENEVTLLTGSLSNSQKDLARKSIKENKSKFIIGTHALIQDKVDMHNLSLVIIDEQHRFGVKQRERLLLKAKSQPHLLSLSATPIPRSLALTVFGELNISRLIEKPKDRLFIETKVITESVLARLKKKIDAYLDTKQQLYVVCPSIEENGLNDLDSVNVIFEKYTKDYPNRKVGILHGKLKADVKNKTMNDFVSNKIQILVSTTVIEVGIDVPNANMMIIYSANNFGLAQLHQLRGRIGRSDKQGLCYLVNDDTKQPSARLKALETSNDGFALAELDLKLRGPGAIYGMDQHGALDLRFAQFDDLKLIKEAKNAAVNFASDYKNLLQYPKLLAVISELQKLTKLN